MNYISLHNHSDASPDGAGTVHSLVQAASHLKMEALAITDHGTLANSVAFATSCYDVGILPILGMEAYLLYNGKRHHMTLLSLNREGFGNLINLDSWSHSENYVGGYPLVTLSKLEEYREGLFALSGCASSPMFVESEVDALNYVADLNAVMGRENVALEVMFIGSHDVWSRPLYFSRKLKQTYMVTNDTHYPCRNQFSAHQIITSARKGYTYDSQHLWLKSVGEIVEEGAKYTDLSLVTEGLKNTMDLMERFTPWDMRASPSLPKIEKAQRELVNALREAVQRDVAEKGGRGERHQRLETEFKILHERNFLDYIYILWDIVSWAKGQGIRVGPGRGSGGGSYVLYLLGITSIDPLHHNLIFERFLNPNRADYPDVDVDFESDRRQEVVNYAHVTWGAIPIATYSCYSHKSAVHDIARVLHIPKRVEDEAAESGLDSDSFDTFLSHDPEKVNSAYKTMLGQIRHRGKHAAGVIIPNQPVPIERSGDELVAAWAEGMNTKDLTKVGIVKYDLLGLTALSQLRLMEELTGESPPTSLHHEEVYDLFCQGDTNGIFQWSGSEGIRELTKRIAPRNFYDLTTCNALYRPGALDAGTAEKYPQYMREPRRLHPRIDPLLKNTYGVLCYQEQVMAVVAEVLGGDLSQADVTRRLISKAAVGDVKWEAEIEALHNEFLVKGEEQGFTPSLIALLWEEIYTHSRYSYNLAHATAYTAISYQMAWYKANHRAAFTTSVLQYDRGNAQSYILDAVQSGLNIQTPHINYSSTHYVLEEDTIYLPLSDVAYLGEKSADALLEEREGNGIFHSYEEFNERVAKRTCNNRVRKSLEIIGAFSGFSGNPGSAIQEYDSTPIPGKYQAQLEVLGYVIPSVGMLKAMNRMREKPAKPNHTRFAGFVQKVSRKKSAHGPYSVYDLSPEGSFWVREDAPSLNVGEFVSGTKNSYGHSKDVKIYSLDGEA